MCADLKLHKVKIETFIEQANKSCGLSYEVFIKNFSSLIDDYVAQQDSSIKPAILELAKQHDYATAEEIETMDKENYDAGLCGHGLDPDCCPAGCGDIEW
mgnify:CR=1 FL=1